MSSKAHTSRTGGFTLIELLTVIAIIGILAAILIPTVGAVRKSAKSTQAISNIRQIGMATALYAQDNKGEILGQGDGNNGYKYFEKTMRQWATYLVMSPKGDKERVDNVLEKIRDPYVPAEDAYGYGKYRSTWAVNRIFSVTNGYMAQGLADSQSDKHRRMEEFLEPSRTIYAVSGAFELTAGNIVDESLLNPPTGRQGIFYYHRDGRATPVLFLDGSARIMDFPIDPKLSKLKQFQ